MALLNSLKVALIGCSGTGSIVFELLMRNRVGEVVAVDPDIVEMKNLTRIINSRVEDARAAGAKAEMLATRSAEIGLGTKVTPFATSILEPAASRAVAACDVCFGCMDSAEGRHVLNLLAAAYLLPYFDVGVHIRPDGAGGVSHLVAASHYLTPGESLLSREVYTPDQLAADGLKRTDPAFDRRNRDDGYLRIPGEDQPAVISLNMQAAVMGFNELLARLHGFRLDDDGDFAQQRLHLTTGRYETSPKGSLCPLFERWVGVGDEILDSVPELSSEHAA